jgi:CRP-like cAMP-binding protein
MLDYEQVRRHVERHWDSVSPTSILGRIGHGGWFLRFVCESGIRRGFDAGTAILSQFSSPRVFLVLEGQVKITDGEGVVGIRGVGDLIGVAEVLADAVDILEAKAISAVVAAEIPARRFRDHLYGDPHVADVIMVWLAQQLVFLQRHRLGFKGTARQRIAQCMLDLGLAVHPRGEIGEFTLPVTQKELAASVGISIASAENELRYLKEAGIVCKKQRRSSTRVLRPAQLRDLLIDSEPPLLTGIPVVDYERFVDRSTAGQVVSLRRGRLRT